MKRASLTSTQLTIIILLIVGFALLLFLFLRFLWEPNINNETCHQSVILRGTTSSLSGLLKGFVPLKCKTNKYCISTRLIGQECEEFAGESGVTKIRVNSKEEIEKFLAGEIVTCWSMMGQGKVDLFSDWLSQEYSLGQVYPTCVICSRIAYDKISLAGKIDLSQINIVQYMASHKMPDKDISYYEYLAGEGAKFSDDVNTKTGQELLNDVVDSTGTLTVEQQAALNEFNKPNNPDGIDISGLQVVSKQVVVNEKYDQEISILFMQISAPSHGEVFKNTILTALGAIGLKGTVKATNPGTYISVPWAQLKGSIFGGTTTTGVGFGTRVVPVKNIVGRAGDTIKGVTVKKAGAIVLGIAVVLGLAQQGVVAWNQDISAGYCGDVSSGVAAREGCSVVRTVEYNVTQMLEYCSWFEGVP